MGKLRAAGFGHIDCGTLAVRLRTVFHGGLNHG
jgi:hypothetical protein